MTTRRRCAGHDTNCAAPGAVSFPLLPKSVQDILAISPVMRDAVFVKDDARWSAELEKAVRRFKERQLAG